MNDKQRIAYEWAKSHQEYRSVAATYARELAGLVDELLGKQKNEPLTLDELRKMDGEPVWLHTFSAANKKTNISQWALVASSGDYSVSFIRVAVTGRLEKKCDDYGKTWTAYRHPLNGQEPGRNV